MKYYAMSLSTTYLFIPIMVEPRDSLVGNHLTTLLMSLLTPQGHRLRIHQPPSLYACHT